MTDAERIAALKGERDRALARAYELSVAYLHTWMSGTSGR